GEGMAVGPFVALAEMEREDAVALVLDPLEDVGHELGLGRPAHQPRVAVDHHEARVLGACHQGPKLAAVAAELRRREDERMLGKPLFDRRQRAARDLDDEVRILDVAVGTIGGAGGAGQEREEEGEKPPYHCAASEKFGTQAASTKCPSPTSMSSGRFAASRVKGGGHAAGSEARPSISASKSRRRSSSGAGTAARSARV